MKKVSIIVPLYNKISFLKKGLLSVENQTYRNIEVIIIDDGSTDGSLEYARKIFSKDKRFVILQQQHSGVSSARNIGLKKANGDYVVFFDADDELKLNYIEELVNNYKKCQLVVSGLITRDYRTGNILNNYRLIPSLFDKVQYNRIFNKQNYTIFALPVCKLFNLNVIRENNLEFDNQQFGEDSIFVLNYLGLIKKIRVIDYSGYINNIIPGTLSRRYVLNIDSQLINILHTLKTNFPLLDSESWSFMLCRSIKLSLINAFKLGKKDFVLECKHLKSTPPFCDIQIRNSLGLNNCVLIILLQLRMYSILYKIFSLFV